VSSKPKPTDRRKSERKPPPGDLMVCELCGQQPEAIAFDPDQCRDECPFKRSS
jgi:hypothetical protein